MDALARFLAEESARLEELRDQLIEASRRAIKHSKNAIYAAIREDLTRASDSLAAAWVAVRELKGIVSQAPDVCCEEIAEVARGEVVEAEIVVRFVAEAGLPAPWELPEEVGFFPYVHGLFDATGEVLRAATERLIKGDKEFADRAKEFIERVYLLGLELNLKRFDLRRKLDYVSNNLQKLTEFRFQAERC